MFDYSGAYGSPIRKRGVYQDPGSAPDMGDAPPSLLNSGDGSSGSPIVAGGDPSLQLSGMDQRRNKWQSFLGGARGGRGIVGGLAGMAGQGGVAGGIGNFAKFMI